MAAENYEENYRSGMEEDALEPAAATPVHVIEPELGQPTPRDVRVKFGTKMGRWIWIAVAIGVPAIFGHFGNASQEKFEALKDHGVEADAALISTVPRKTGKRGHAPRGTFSYTVGAFSHTITTDFSDEQYRSARIGDRRRIKYLPEQPDEARFIEDFAGGANYAWEPLLLWTIAGVGGLILIGLWFFAERRRSLRKHLASEGVAVPTTSLQTRKTSTKSNDNNWEVSYEYQFDGKTLAGSATFPLPEMQKLLVRSNTATVLVDPADPARHELYAEVKKAMEIVPAGGLRSA